MYDGNTIEKVIQEINQELAPKFENKLRFHLETQDKAWLIEQIIRLTMDKQSRQESDRKVFQKIKQQQRAARLVRLKEIELDEAKLDVFIREYEKCDHAVPGFA